MSATPDSKRIGGTRFVSLTVSSSSAAHLPHFEPVARFAFEQRRILRPRAVNGWSPAGAARPARRAASSTTCRGRRRAARQRADDSSSERCAVDMAFTCLVRLRATRGCFGGRAEAPEDFGLDRERVASSSCAFHASVICRLMRFHAPLDELPHPRRRRDRTGAAPPAPFAVPRAAGRGAAATGRGSRSCPARTPHRRGRGRPRGGSTRRS